jgi:hypothetical protein
MIGRSREVRPENSRVQSTTPILSTVKTRKNSFNHRTKHLTLGEVRPIFKVKNEILAFFGDWDLPPKCESTY